MKGGEMLLELSRRLAWTGGPPSLQPALAPSVQQGELRDQIDIALKFHFGAICTVSNAG